MRALILAAALALAAAPAAAQQLPAPTPDDIAVRVSADQSGQSVTASVGDGVAIELQSSPGAGASWRVASKPDFLSDPEQISGQTFAQQAGAPPRVGAPRWQVFVFGVTGAGAGDVVLEKRGPANRTGAPLETFTITITAE